MYITNNNLVMNIIERYGNWTLIFTDFVPIPLLITLEMVRFA